MPSTTTSNARTTLLLLHQPLRFLERVRPAPPESGVAGEEFPRSSRNFPHAIAPRSPLREPVRTHLMSMLQMARDPNAIGSCDKLDAAIYVCRFNG